VARIVIASRAVKSPLSTFDAVWMTCSTATRTTRHYEAATGVRADEHSPDTAGSHSILSTVT